MLRSYTSSAADSMATPPTTSLAHEAHGELARLHGCSAMSVAQYLFSFERCSLTRRSLELAVHILRAIGDVTWQFWLVWAVLWAVLWLALWGTFCVFPRPQKVNPFALRLPLSMAETESQRLVEDEAKDALWSPTASSAADAVEGFLLRDDLPPTRRADEASPERERPAVPGPTDPTQRMFQQLWRGEDDSEDDDEEHMSWVEKKKAREEKEKAWEEKQKAYKEAKREAVARVEAALNNLRANLLVISDPREFREAAERLASFEAAGRSPSDASDTETSEQGRPVSRSIFSPGLAPGHPAVPSWTCERLLSETGPKLARPSPRRAADADAEVGAGIRRLVFLEGARECALVCADSCSACASDSKSRAQV